MSEFPKVTIIIPVYNGKEYMRQSIDSALAQTYKNLEILVINDGSNDNGETEKIALEYGDKVKYYKKENGGVSTVLNKALDIMEGEFFSWLSHDDVYYPDKIEKQIKYLKENNLLDKKIILYTDYELIDEKSKIIAKCTKNHKMLEEKPEYSLLRGSVNGITLLIPKQAFVECGKFDETLRCTQDYDLWYKMMKKYSFIHLPIILAKSRYHIKQVSLTNPKVVTEGNELWINMLENIETNRKIKLEQSIYNYYLEMEKFLKDTPYVGAQEYCKNICKKLENEVKNKSKNVLVSIIIPFYNRNKVVIKAIKTALNQTHKNIEIIVVNDGSTEDISEVKNYIIENSDFVKLISLDKNSGPSHARNIGMDNAKGIYIAFLDSDDEFYPEKIEEQLIQMMLNNALVSHTSYQRKGFNTDIIINTGEVSGEVRRRLIYNCPIATPTVMINTEYINSHNYRFNEKLSIGEDTCFWLEILNNITLLGINKPLTIVNSNENSAAYNDEKQVLGLKTILKYVLNNAELNCYDKEISILARCYSNYVDKINMDEIVDDMNIDRNNIERVKRWIRTIRDSIKEMGIIKTFEKIIKKIYKKIRRK